MRMKSEMDFNLVLTIATNLGYLIAGGFVCYFVVRKKLTEYFQDIKNGLSVGSKIPKQAKTDVEIVKRMEQVKEVLNADRVLVCEFHNGEHYANGRSALKFSCTYEVVRVGISNVQRLFTSIPISCMTNFISTLLDKETLVVKDVEDIKDSMPATYSIKKEAGITSFQDLIIRNEKNEPVGFIAIHWCNGKKMCSNDAELYRLAAYVEEHILSEIK